MFSTKKAKLPEQSMLQPYAAFDGCYTDCYVTQIDGAVDLADFVFAFYVTWLFKLERFVLSQIASKPSTDEQARQVANDGINHFAAWRVEQRDTNQLLMCDLSDRTRSWFMTSTTGDGGKNATHLYFGSAVVPVANSTDEKPTLGFLFNALLGFHKIYSRALLSAAKAQLARTGKIGSPVNQ